MAAPTELRKGKVINYQGHPHLVLEMLHRTQGRQAGFVQTSLRNLSSGTTTSTKFRSTDTVEILHTDSRKLEFSYVDTEGYHFMDPESFEDFPISENIVEDQKNYLVENNLYDVLFINEKAIRIQLPAAVEMKVEEAPEAVRGDTASNVQKPITTESGLVVQVPLFIKKDEVIRVSTDDGTYLGRA